MTSPADGPLAGDDDLADLAADDELMERLRRITATADPVPEAVIGGGASRVRPA